MRISRLFVATTSLALLTSSAVAQEKPKTAAPASAAPKSTAPKAAAAKSTTAAKPAAAPAPIVSPEIRAALGRMAKAMSALTSFQVKTDLTSEEVLESGQKLQSSSVITADARRPDRLFIDSSSERKARKYYYDGKSLTIFGPVNHYYATVDAPPTTYQMLKAIADKFGVDTPLADLFEWGSGAVELDTIKSAMVAGTDRIGDQVCEQYAFRQPGVDWQVWIRKAEPSLPCKLVIVSTDDTSQPATSMVFTWSTNQQFADDHFVFTPPADAQRIVLGTIEIQKPGSSPKTTKVSSK